MSDLVSEDHILARIASHFPNEGPDVLLGRGDDCAVLGVSGPLCVSTDLFMEDVHFRRSYFTPEDIGWKALAVNLSDLAADGARPMGFTVGLSLPPDADMALVDGLCAGMAELAAQASVPLVGGDLSRADKLHLCLTVFGQAEKTLLRGEAQPGDVIFLIGRTGLARAGLLLLEERGRAALNEWPIPCEAHLRPAPRLKEGMRLSRLAADWGRGKGDPTCGRLGLMDLSDGLARDLPRLVGPGMGADIDMPMPHTEILRFMRSRNEAEPVAAAKRHAFLGGEDYALIGYPTYGEYTSSGILSFNNQFVITKFCENKAIAWDFIKSAVAPKMNYSQKLTNDDLPITRGSFNKLCKVMYGYEFEYYYGGGFYCHPADPKNPLTSEALETPGEVIRFTERDAEILLDYLDNECGSAVSESIPYEVSSIINEEISTFLGGAKTAEECAKIIQSRISILLSEIS